MITEKVKFVLIVIAVVLFLISLIGMAKDDL